MNKTNDITVKFREIQRFRQKWLWIAIAVVLLSLIISFGYGMIEQLVFGRPWGNRPMSDTGLEIVGSFMILMGIGISWLFLRIKLLVEVCKDGVHINFAPLVRRTILFGDIVSCEVRTYSPMREYGGWGVKSGRAGKAYNVSGNRGVLLKLSSGKGLLIGSQRPDELVQAIQAGMRE